MNKFIVYKSHGDFEQSYRDAVFNDRLYNSIPKKDEYAEKHFLYEDDFIIDFIEEFYAEEEEDNNESEYEKSDEYEHDEYDEEFKQDREKRRLKRRKKYLKKFVEFLNFNVDNDYRTSTNFLKELATETYKPSRISYLINTFGFDSI